LSIANSENVVLDDEQGGGATKDFQDFETTHNEEADADGVTESERDRSLVSLFLEQVIFSKSKKTETVI
jgi:hypothetical protein